MVARKWAAHLVSKIRSYFYKYTNYLLRSCVSLKITLYLTIALFSTENIFLAIFVFQLTCHLTTITISFFPTKNSEQNEYV